MRRADYHRRSRSCKGKRVSLASFLHNEPAVTCSDVRPQLRKSIIRAELRKRVRPPSSDAELAATKTRIVRWEIDFWDRTAVPLCAITQDGRTTACASLIRSYGDEEQPYLSKVAKLLGTIDDSVLNVLFKFPNAPQHPFDILQEFPGFRAHFCALIRARKKPAEIGRVAVDPDIEALVDTAVSFARTANPCH